MSETGIMMSRVARHLTLPAIKSWLKGKWEECFSHSRSFHAVSLGQAGWAAHCVEYRVWSLCAALLEMQLKIFQILSLALYFPLTWRLSPTHPDPDSKYFRLVDKYFGKTEGEVNSHCHCILYCRTKGKQRLNKAEFYSFS